jgi:Heparinase II/III-like protein/Heparinase II/III N-terminus
MASGWRNKLTRVSQMNWEEVRVRVGQELHKRGDLLRHRVGMENKVPRMLDDSGVSDSGLSWGKFFFSAGESAVGIVSEASERAELLRKYLPEEAAQILRDADDICEHRFRLLGYENLDYGKVIDWHLDLVHGKHAPLDPWFKIPFLDFSVVGDHKITWELNRHQHLVTLAKARLLTGDAKYTDELIAQWRSWIKANSYPLGINWGSSLEVAFRGLSWIWVDQLLANSPDCADFRAEMMPALAFHGKYIERYLSTYFSPNTHLLGEAVALFFLGTLYPQMPGAARWKKSGWQIVLQESERQVRPDGVYFEQSLHYHVYALDFFLHARLLASRNGVEIPHAYDAVLDRMLDVVAALAQAGPAEGFGDDDGGRLFNPRRNRTEQTSDPLALGALIYSLAFSAARLTEESIWLFGSRAVEQLSISNAQPKQIAVAKSVSFPDGGIYVMADSDPFAQVLAIDAGPQGVGRSGHGHADALSLRLTMNGKRWLVDSGSGVYISDDIVERNHFRGTAAHNTLRIDGQDQAIADEAFSWTHIPTTRVESWIAGNSFSYFVGSHNGYERLPDPVKHRRQVLKIAGGPCLVRDLALGQMEHEVEVCWNFASDLDVRSVGAGRIDVSRAGASPHDVALSLLVPEETVWQTGTKINATRLSPSYGVVETAPVIRSRATMKLPAEIATALLPKSASKHDADVFSEPRLTSVTDSAVQVYELNSRDDSQSFIFALSDRQWSFGPWSSDAKTFYCRIHKERLTHFIAIGATFAAWHGQDLLRSAGPSNFFEWREGDAEFNADPKSFSVTSVFRTLTASKQPTNGMHSSVDHGSPSYVEKH